MTTLPTPVPISDATLAFPASALEFMPAWEDIPDEFKSGSPWRRLATSWFYEGLSPLYAGFLPQDGIDPDMATRQLSAIQGSYAPKHEHKMASVAYLCSLWFTWVMWAPKDGGRDDAMVFTGEDNAEGSEEFLVEWLDHCDKKASA